MNTEDPIYEQAKLVARSTDKLCIANLQRHLMIGYNRASRLMEAMIEDGMVERFDTGYGGIGYRLVTPNVKLRGAL
jgi:DNA segregation ATPase FtsK/SpoIIIE-like protein